MKKSIVLLLLIAVTGISFAQKKYYKGNTHTHSSPGSGDAAKTWTADTAVAKYRAMGYDFLVFTEHGEYWNADSLSTPDFTVISGEEAGIAGSGRWGHFTAMKISSKIIGRNKTHQELLDEIANQGGLGFLNHPRWTVIPISASKIIDSMKQNLRHFEVFNGNTDKPTRFDTSLWDSVLTTGRVMYGVASDDTHKENHFGKGWICVYASSKHPDTLFNAIRNGEFYSSNGILIDTIGRGPDKMFVRSANGTRVRFIGSSGRILAQVEGNEAVYNIRGDEGYVRAEISNGLDQTAWIQPSMIQRAR
jgi:predicted metal-dependent phosphoesterase TrpH